MLDNDLGITITLLEKLSIERKKRISDVLEEISKEEYGAQPSQLNGRQHKILLDERQEC